MGERLRLNCTLAGSKPAAALNWYINEEKVGTAAAGRSPGPYHLDPPWKLGCRTFEGTLIRYGWSINSQ